MLDQPLALVSMSPCLPLPQKRDRAGLIATACAFTATATVVIWSFLAGMPLLSMGVLAIAAVIAAVTSSVASSSLGAPSVVPDEIVSRAARASYRDALVALADIERAIEQAPELRTMLAPLYERCHAVIDQAGRMARGTNAVQRYLDTHLAAYLVSEIERLHVTRESTADDVARQALDRAAAVRSQQLTVYQDLVARRDRVVAQLELVDASLGAVAATIVKLHAVDGDQRTGADDGMSSRLGDITDQLSALESALGPELAA